MVWGKDERGCKARGLRQRDRPSIITLHRDPLRWFTLRPVPHPIPLAKLTFQKVLHRVNGKSLGNLSYRACAPSLCSD